jgi:hypothetical protein
MAAILQAEISAILKGWRENGIRERVDRFIQGGIQPLPENVDTSSRVLIHGDFSSFATHPICTQKYSHFLV